MTVTVLYDADCGFCTRSAATAVRFGATADFLPLTADDRVDAERARQELPAVLPDGRVVYGAEAVGVALGTGPRWMRGLARAMALPPVAALARKVYRWVAANRHRLPGGTAACDAVQGRDR